MMLNGERISVPSSILKSDCFQVPSKAFVTAHFMSVFDLLKVVETGTLAWELNSSFECSSVEEGMTSLGTI